METSPTSPDMDEIYDIADEEVIYVGDVDEAIDILEEDLCEPESVEGYHEGIDHEKGDSTFVFDRHEGAVFCSCLSKNGKLAATGGEDDKAYIWNTETGEVTLECTGHKDSVIFAEFNPDESLLATADMSGVIKLWQMNDNKLIWEYNMGDASWVKWHPVANVLFGGSVDGLVYMWKVPQGDCKIFQGHSHRTESAALFPDGKRIVVGYEDGTLRVIDLKTGSILSSILSKAGHSSTITALDCYMDNNLILSTAVDGRTILSTSQGKVVSILQDLNNDKGNSSTQVGDESSESNGNWVETAAFCKAPGFQVAATGTINGEIFIWDIARKVLRQKIPLETGVSKLLWKDTTSLLFAACLDGILRCFEARTNQCIRSFAGHTDNILDVYISQDGNTALTASDDATARIFDIKALT